MFRSVEALFRTNRVFVFLLLYRWLSLLPAIFTLSVEASPATRLSAAWSLTVAFLVNLVISILNRPLNKLVINHPILLGIDLIFSAFILSVSGGYQSPYFLYALSPLLA